MRAAEVSVSTDVSRIVTAVDVKEGQPVKAGDVLFRIEPQQYQNALDTAKATLANTGLNIDALKADYQEALRTIAAQQAIVSNDQLTVDRFSDLVKGNLAITRRIDQARLTLESDKEKLASLPGTGPLATRAVDGKPEHPNRPAPAIPAGESAGRRSAAPVRPYDCQSPFRRDRYACR